MRVVHYWCARRWTRQKVMTRILKQAEDSRVSRAAAETDRWAGRAGGPAATAGSCSTVQRGDRCGMCGPAVWGRPGRPGGARGPPPRPGPPRAAPGPGSGPGFVSQQPSHRSPHPAGGLLATTTKSGLGDLVGVGSEYPAVRPPARLAVPQRRVGRAGVERVAVVVAHPAVLTRHPRLGPAQLPRAANLSVQ